MRDLLVIHEDNHLLVVNKPAGLLVQGDRSGDVTLLDVAGRYLKEKFNKPGNVYLGLVHRLDRNVSGVVLLAKTSKAAGRMAIQFRDKTVLKTYLAVAERPLPGSEGELRDWLAAKGDSRGVTRAEGTAFDGGKESLLRYRTLEENHGRSLIEVVPVTGRRHQIRAQLALAGSPLLGDVKYGAAAGLPRHRIALHAWKLAVRHPVTGQELEFIADPPEGWPWHLA